MSYNFNFRTQFHSLNNKYVLKKTCAHNLPSSHTHNTFKRLPHLHTHRSLSSSVKSHMAAKLRHLTLKQQDSRAFSEVIPREGQNLNVQSFFYKQFAIDETGEKILHIYCYLSLTGHGRHVLRPSMDEKMMVGRCRLKRSPFFSR